MTRINTIVLIYLILSFTSKEIGCNFKKTQNYSYINNLNSIYNHKGKEVHFNQITLLPLIDTTVLRTGDYKIMILSKYLIDSLSSDSPIWFYPLFLDQKVILCF